MTQAKPRLDEIKAGDIVVLRGRTQKGKNRVREHGERWFVREHDRSVLSRNLGILVCPASYVGTARLDPAYDSPTVIFQRDGYCRWVSTHSTDPDFEIVAVAAREAKGNTA